MNSYATLRRSGWDSVEELERATKRAGRVGDEQMADRIRWVRSYALAEEDGRLGTVCIHQAESPEAIRAHASRAFFPVDEIVPISGTVVARDGRRPGRGQAAGGGPPPTR